MAPNSSGWWTDEKVDATVTSQYVHSHLRPNEAEQLTKSVFGDLSDDTYLEWILTRAKRFFLTLVEAGVPDQIFGVIDDSWDDEDLPIPEDEVSGLLLSAEPDKTLDRRFYKAQFKYLIRVVGDGEHIRYAEEETIPVNAVASKPVISKSKHGMDKVKLSSDSNRIFARKRLAFRDRFVEEEMLAEMAEWRSFAHRHVLSIFGSYTTRGEIHILMTPGSEMSLKSFLSDTPKAFEALPKTNRRQRVLQWSHCLAGAIAWLHKNGKHHGAIRPSRIQMDEHLDIFLGQFDGTGLLCDDTIKDDIEAYQYAAPERWKRSVTVQNTGNGRVALPSGGRTGRRLTLDPDRTLSADKREEASSSSGSQRLNTARPTSVSYAFSPTSKTGTRLRLGSNKGVASTLGGDPRQSESRQSGRAMEKAKATRTSTEAHIRPGASSALSSSSNEAIRARRQPGPIFAATPEMRTAVIQTWASAQHDQLAADIFSIGAVMMEILTFLCKQSSSSFARHRASKNKSGGRGGGLADASFHANIGQVASWAQMLQRDVEKRIRKEDGEIYKAVGPSLQVVLQCMEREPPDRLGAVELERKLSDHMRDFAGLGLPLCCLQAEADQTMGRSGSRSASVDLTRRVSTMPKVRRTASRVKSQIIPRGPENSGLPKLTPRFESLKLSPAHLNNFDFHEESTTQTLVDSGTSTSPPQNTLGTPQAQARPDSFAFTTGDEVEVFPRPPTANSKRRQPTLDMGDETASISMDTSIAEAAMMGLSVPASYAGSLRGGSEDFQSAYSYTPPTLAYPTRDLPPVPRSSSLRNAALTSNPYPTRSTSKAAKSPVVPTESEPSPALPSIDKQPVSHTSRPISTQAKARNYQHHRYTQIRPKTPTGVEDVDGVSPVSTPDRDKISPVSSPEAPSRPATRLYRTPSRMGSNEGRLYISQPIQDQIALRELQHP